MELANVLMIILMFLLSTTSCGSLEYESVDDENNTKIEFEVYAKGYTLADPDKWEPMLGGYEEGCIITNEDEFENLENRIGVSFEEDVDFSKDMLFVMYERSFGPGSKIATWDIVDMAYSDDIFLVEFTTKGAVTLYPEYEEDFVGAYNIVKIAKDDFPYEERDYFSYNNGEGQEEIPEKVIVYR